METKTLFTTGWKFLKTDLNATWEEMQAQSEHFAPVELPHDWLIYNTKDLYEDSCGWYRKLFDWEGKNTEERIQLRFDGVYMDSTLYVNGHRVGDWKYGYSTFTIDITEFLIRGENQIVLQVRHQSPNSRWYSGAGIYRNVWLKRCKKVYLPLDGTYVNIKPDSKKQGSEKPDRFILEAETEVAGAFTKETGCHFALYKDGEPVQDLGVAFCKEDASTCDRKVSALANEKSVDVKCTMVALRACVEAPELWDIEDSQCYQLMVELTDGTEVLDAQENTIGFRTMEFCPDKGFFLNGRNVKVHGVCEHHDFGCLGAAYSEAAMARKLHTLRGMGVNAIRTSHNMQAPEFLEMADKMGFLVMDEAFDMWERCKTTYDYGRFFKEWAIKDVESWIRRDRNHPCVFLWSIGNEIYDTHADEYGQEITKRLVEYVRAHDPKGNAPITIGSNFMPWENAQKCADIVKYAGYNYAEKYYADHHKEHPDWIIYGSETASIVHSRGIYHFPLAKSIMADEDLQCSALGNSSTSWGAKSIEACICDDRDATFAFGQFLWTGCDYIGEPTPYHTKNSYFGQIDTAGFPKDAYYIFKAEWTDAEKEPMVHVFPYWDFNEGQLIDVRACTNGASVELFVNGKSMGRQEIDHAHGRKLLGDWQVPYEPGTITAVAYDKEGREIARDSRNSFGDSERIVLSVDKTTLLADGKDMCFVTIQNLDKEGRVVENAADYVEVSVQGAGRLLGLDNGDSTDYDAYKAKVRKLFSGKLLAVIGSTLEAGEIVVTVSSRRLQGAEVRLTAEGAGIGVTKTRVMENCGEDGADIGENKMPCTEISYMYDCMKCPCENEGDVTDVPVRKVALTAKQGTSFSPECKEIMIEAAIFPEDAKDKELIWQVVNDGGVAVNFAAVEEVENNGNVHIAKVTAFGDGDFRVRCMSKSGRAHVTVISQMECTAEGLGKAFIKPYELISASLYADTIGEISNGNEKGIATARDGMSGVIFEQVDFGEYGSDEIIIPIFSMGGPASPIEIWLGRPHEEGSRLLDTLRCKQKPIWNTYQNETLKLPERIKGIVTIAFVMREKVHMKGFYFKYCEKAFGKLYAGEADKVYGDSFSVQGNTVEEIGNNVTLEFGNMDFGERGTEKIAIWGRTPLAANTIHIHFTNEAGETVNRIVEFRGDTRNFGDKIVVDAEKSPYNMQEFAIERLCGKGTVEFIFLPGSRFDFEMFRFI